MLIEWAAMAIMAESVATRPPVAIKPSWVRLPAAEDMVRHYPEAALRASVEGRAAIQCIVVDDGTLTDCRVQEESPPGYGFGEAVLRMSVLFKMTPRMADGRPVGGGSVVIPIRFLLPDDEPVARDAPSR